MLQDLAAVQKQTNTVQDRSENKQMETQGAIQVLNQCHPTWNSAEIFDQHNSLTDTTSMSLPVAILHGHRSINPSVWVYIEESNYCKHRIKVSKKNFFSYLSGNHKTFKPI